MTLTAVMRRMQLEAVPHGMRSSFRTWAAETTNYPRDLLEHCLAHTIESKVEAAYQHSSMIEKRRGIMQHWADFLDKPSVNSDNVIPIKSANA